MNTYKKVILLTSIAGTLFSGYLAGIKLFSKACAFNETCPYFLGYPACFFGFGIFFVLLIISIFGILDKVSSRMLMRSNIFVSFLGVLFAGQYIWGETQAIMNGARYSLGLPTCTYGFIFFAFIFIYSFLQSRKQVI